MKGSIGDNILKLRLRQGLTQDQLAKGICDRSHISMIEAGKCTPSISLLEKIASRLHLTLPDLLRDVAPPSREASFAFDLLIDHLESLINDHQFYDGSVLIRKHLRHPNIVGSPSKLAILYRYAGVLEALKERYDRADSNLKRAKKYAIECCDQKILSDVNVSIGALNNLTKNYSESETIFQNLLPATRSASSLVTDTKIYYGLGRSFHGQKKYKQATCILKPQLEYLMKNNSTLMYGEISALIASCFEHMDAYTEAISHYKKALSFYQFRGNVGHTSLIYRKISDCYHLLDHQEEYLTFFNLSVKSPSLENTHCFLDRSIPAYF